MKYLKITNKDRKKYFLPFIALMAISTSTVAQYSNNSTVPATDRMGSNKARVIFFNDDQSSNKNENFFVSFGNQNNWWRNVKFEVQREGGISARSGLFMDWGPLYLVADWDNTSGGEDIIFGFDSNRRDQIKEKMRLTDEGRLGIGTNSPNQKLDVKGYGRFQNSTSNFLDIGHGGSNSFINHNGAGDLDFRYKSGTIMTLTQGGSLGIGTETPAEKLDVNGFGRFHSSSENFLNLGHGGSNSFINHNGTGNLDFRFQGTNLMTLTQSGSLGLGTRNPSEKLHVEGSIKIDNGNLIVGQSQLSSSSENSNTLLNISGGVKTDKVILNIGTFPDYVFDASYPLMPIKDVENYIKENKHLPNIPSEKEMVKSGLDLQMINIKLVEKVEELTLYTIQQEHKIESQQQLIQELMKRLDQVENKLTNK